MSTLVWWPSRTVPGERPAEAAAERIVQLFDPERIDALLANAKSAGVGIDGPDGLINRMIKAVLERGVEVERADHLGYDRGDSAGTGSGNSRNGFTVKTVITAAEQTRIEVPRDWASSFEPQLVPKRTRRLGATSDMILRARASSEPYVRAARRGERCRLQSIHESSVTIPRTGRSERASYASIAALR